MKNWIFLLGFGATIFLQGCSSSTPELREEDNTETIEKDYLVRGASSNVRPGWIEDPNVWAQQSGEDTVKYRYFVFESTPKVDRQIACSLAKTHARADIASEIASFIEKTLGSSTEGQASIDENNPNAQPMREFVENTLAEKVQGMIHGASVWKTYWEQRKYEKKLGAKRDFTAYTCAALVRIETERLKEAVDKASQLVQNKAADPEMKEKVKKALSEVSENFVKARQGIL